MRSPIVIPPRDANIEAWQTKVALAFNQLSAQVKPRIVPLVDSSVPAVFIQNTDGSLIFTEIE